MAKDSPNTKEPEFLDESKEEEKAKASSSFPDAEKHEEEYLEDDTNDFEEVDVEGEDVDEEYEEDRAEGPGGEDKSASEKRKPESEGESPKKQEKKWKSILSSSSDEEEEDSHNSDDSNDYDDSDDYDSDEDDEDSEERPLAKKLSTESLAEKNSRLMIESIESEAKLPREERTTTTLKDQEEYLLNKQDPFNFPVDPEGWREEDLMEVWEDAPSEVLDPGWDPVFADEDDREIMMEVREEGGYPPVAPFYLPYRRPYPVIPDNHRDINNPKSVIEELDRIEEFLKWVSYIFPDGSS